MTKKSTDPQQEELPIPHSVSSSIMQRLLVAFLAVADASRLRAPVFSPLQSVAPLSLDEGALDNATAPPVDRVFEYPKDFRLDEPFTLSLSSHESVLVPLEPIRSKLFGNSNAGSTAIGFELSTCQGKVLTTIAMQDGSSRRLSSADYQCATMVKTPSTVPVDLCPIVRGDRDIAIHKDPTQVKGFIVRAYESAEVVALLRSTKDKGAFNSAFFLTADPVEADASRRLNVSFTAKSTQLAFASARTWRPSDNTTTASICSDCEFALYAQMATPSNNSDLLPRAPPPPYCLSSRDSIKYTLPTVSSSASQHVTLPSGFGDLFSTSGEYSFVLVASMPASSNNGHPAYFTYAPARVTVAGRMLLGLALASFWWNGPNVSLLDLTPFASACIL
jgi:hypothetical protein